MNVLSMFTKSDIVPLFVCFPMFNSENSRRLSVFSEI